MVILVGGLIVFTEWQLRSVEDLPMDKWLRGVEAGLLLLAVLLAIA